MKKICFFLFFIPSIIIYPVKLSWKLENNSVLKIIKKADYILEYNKQQVFHIDNINKLSLSITNVSKKGFHLNGIFKTFYRENEYNPYSLDKIYHANFIIQSNGHFLVKRNVFMPNIRSIPTFPEYDLQPGDSWKAPAVETFQFSRLLKLNFTVDYNLQSITVFSNQPAVKIIINYNMFYTKRSDDPIDFPMKINSFSFSTLYFDYKNGIPLYKIEKYSLSILDAMGNLSEHKQIIESFYNIYKPITTDELSDKLKKSLSDEHIAPAIKFTQENNGVNINLGKVLFDYNSSELTKNGKNILNKIYSVIQKYPSTDILVKGFTDNIGSQEFNIKLSEKRASTTTDFLIKKGIDKKRIFFKGYGSANPIAPNTTEENRKKNRRVELFIYTR